MQSLVLRDGRTLAFDDVGDPAGYPVVWHHGSMSCRLLRHPDDSLAAAEGLRLICVDRPGYGRSSPQSGRTLRGWADDIEQLADHLGLGRFAVAGASAGGPNALAVARYLEGRVTIFTTNFSDFPRGQSESLTDRVSARIRSRLYEMCRRLELRGRDYRAERLASREGGLRL